jgi:Skp family chaperone for outer membrane proteins
MEIKMKKLIINIGCLLILVSGIVLSQQETSKIRVGIFDSRCVALAYGRSAEFMKEMDSIKTAHKNAAEEGNKEIVDELEQLGPTKQVLMHQQVFSNGSINNILEKIKDKLPAVARGNDLRMIISKWEIPFIDGSFELVDITDQLVAMFGPDDATKKIIDSIKAMEPVPIEQISINPMD